MPKLTPDQQRQRDDAIIDLAMLGTGAAMTLLEAMHQEPKLPGSAYARAINGLITWLQQLNYFGEEASIDAAAWLEERIAFASHPDAVVDLTEKALTLFAAKLEEIQSRPGIHRGVAVQAAGVHSRLIPALTEIVVGLKARQTPTMN